MSAEVLRHQSSASDLWHAGAGKDVPALDVFAGAAQEVQRAASKPRDITGGREPWRDHALTLDGLPLVEEGRMFGDAEERSSSHASDFHECFSEGVAT